MSESLGIGSRVKHPAFGDGVVIKLHKVAYDLCFTLYGIKSVGREYDNWEIIEAIPVEDEVSFSDAERALVKILSQYNALEEEIPLGEKWIGGTMVLQPEDNSLKAKEIDIEVFFHKIVMVRDRLRVMEQRINSSKLTDEEKVNLQQYISRIYGSLTSFNVLFKYKENHFSGK